MLFFKGNWLCGFQGAGISSTEIPEMLNDQSVFAFDAVFTKSVAGAPHANEQAAKPYCFGGHSPYNRSSTLFAIVAWMRG